MSFCDYLACIRQNPRVFKLHMPSFHKHSAQQALTWMECTHARVAQYAALDMLTLATYVTRWWGSRGTSEYAACLLFCRRSVIFLGLALIFFLLCWTCKVRFSFCIGSIALRTCLWSLRVNKKARFRFDSHLQACPDCETPCVLGSSQVTVRLCRAAKSKIHSSCFRWCPAKKNV